MKYFLKLSYPLILFIFLTSSMTNFCLASALDQYFKRLGASSNYTQAGSYKDQQAGYFSGGGFALRQNQSSVSPVNFSLPKMGVGCNGVDLYAGSLSFIKADKLAQTARAIGTGIPLYALKLGMKTVAPQIESTISYIEKIMHDMNALMLDSCQASQMIVGGLWPKGTAASEQICMDAKRGSDMDWFGARDHCSKDVSSEISRAKSQEKNKDLMVGEYNLVWHVIRKMDEYGRSGSQEVAEFAMSVVGTLISYKDGDQFRVRIIEPRADQKEFLAAYLKGGSTTVLSCDEGTKCLSPRAVPVTISNTISDNPNEAQNYATMKAKVWNRINTLREKYLKKEDFGEGDIGFLNDSVNLPVYKYIQISAAAGSKFMLQDSAEYIAAAVLLSQFERITTEILEAIDALQKIQIEDTAIQDFKQTVQAMRSRLQMMLSEANQGSLETLNNAIRAIEQKIIATNS
jgi:conjugative transfer pilus assembly protein TraH